MKYTGGTAKFKMVGAPDLTALENAVNTHMENGWKPHGAPFSDGPYWWQAMVRSE